MEKDAVINALKTVSDPELRLDVWTLGLIYDISIDNDNVTITMTLTSPGCPYGPAIIEAVKTAVKEDGAAEVTVNIVFDPPWKPPEEVKWAIGGFSPWSA